MKNLYILLVLTSILPVRLPAQDLPVKPVKNKPERIIYRGKVVDENGEAIAFVNVFMAKGKYGTTTDFDGKFILKTRRKRGKITFSATGYETKIVKIKPKVTYLKVVLKQAKNVLDEVVIIRRPKKHIGKKENPAYKILKQIWKRRKTNGLKRVPYYEYKKYETTEIGLNHLDRLFLKKLFKKDIDEMMKDLPYDDEGLHYYIPIYIKESVYHIFGDNKLDKKRVDIEAEKSKGFYRQGFVFDRMANKFDEVDIYNNTFNLFNKPFVSPISRTGFDTYDYLLYDSIQKAGSKFYNIYFWPRRDEDLAFTGNFLVSGQNFAVTKIQMKLNKQANVNFVRGVEIEKEYSIVNDSIYLPKTDIFSGDFTLLDKNDRHKGLNIKKIYHYSDYNFQKKYSPAFYDKKIIKYTPNQFEKDSTYWHTYNNLTNSLKTYHLIDKVKNKKPVRNINKWLNIITTGYFDIGHHLQFGPLFQVVGRNGVEALRLSAGIRTFKTNNDRFRFYGHVAYGIKDDQYKWGVQLKYLASYKPRIELGISLSDDYVQQARSLMDVGQIMFIENLGTNFPLSRGKNVFISRVEERSLKVDYRVAKNFHLGIIPSYKIIRPARRQLFNMDYIADNQQLKTRVTDIGSDFYLTYTPGRDVYGLGVEQRYGKNSYPSFIINYHRGMKGFGGDFDYDKLQFRYMQRVIFGKIGKTDVSVEAGKTFGTVPLALLNPIPANQILLLKPNTFSLLNYYDFVTDTYLVGHFEHHFNGFILNRLPLIRKLKWRTIVAFRSAYGTISDRNKDINRSDIHYVTPSPKMYYEYSLGLENIGYGNLRFIRIDAVWRSDYTSINSLYSPKFAVRLAIRPDF